MPAAVTAPAKIYHLNAHEAGPLPCLCARHLASAGERVVVDGEAFVRREARAKDRVLYYWLPEVSAPAQKAVQFAIERRMRTKLANVIVHSGANADDDEDDE
jgi:hypothetical protein